MAKSKDGMGAIQVIEMDTNTVQFGILGTTPLIFNRMTEKAKRELLLPAGQKTKSQKAVSLKHDPIREFQASPYTERDNSAPTLLLALAVWFKRGMASAALDIPGVEKSKIDRMLWGRGDRLNGERISLYGIPQLLMSVTRSKDQARTPDIRSRVIVPRWCCTVTIEFPVPQLNDVALTNLLVAAGMLSGIGDWRNQKGSGRYGSYRPIDCDDREEFDEIMETGGRAAQIAAMEDPQFYDIETEELYEWFAAEVKVRGKHDLLSPETKSTMRRREAAAAT